ncbi:CocE/NonD family hydrolase C-terminal non-catalytic domain-containing protein [Caulobacter segnis]
MPRVNLVASTSGTDSDWVVKLIDVYPDEVPNQPELGGYQLAVGADIFRGRYRESFSDPKALKPNTPLKYQFILPTANYTPSSRAIRIMVQVSPAGSRSMTATPRPSCRTSSSPSRPTM